MALSKVPEGHRSLVNDMVADLEVQGRELALAWISFPAYEGAMHWAGTIRNRIGDMRQVLDAAEDIAKQDLYETADCRG